MKKQGLNLNPSILLGVSTLGLILLTSSIIAGPPEVVCVPASGLNPTIPHDTWSGLNVTLKGTAHDPDGDHTLTTYEWDFGDGSPVETGSVADPYAIENKHTYIGDIGDLYVATLTVTDSDGETGADQYLVVIKDGADLAIRVNVAIDEGLWRLHADMERSILPDGTPIGLWSYAPGTVAATGASTEAFEIHGSLPTGNSTEDPYVETVQRGLNFLLSQLYLMPVSQDLTYCPAGDPDVNGNGIGLLSYGLTVYESGISLMALSSSGCPGCIAATGIPTVMGRSYLDIAQDMVDAFSFCQTEIEPWRGGWRYFCNASSSDNSVSQWPVIGMEAAEVNFGAAGLIVPQFVKDELSLWIDYIQNDVDGDSADGGSGYTDPEFPNIARTGGLLAEMKFVGDTSETQRVKDATDFVYRAWDVDPEHFPGNSYYAFYSVMKGLRLLGIELFTSVDETIEWSRDSGNPGDILGTWSGLGGEIALTLYGNGAEDRAFELVGNGSCAGGEADGTYLYNSGSGELTITVDNSTFTSPCDIGVGIYEFTVTEITSSTMTWEEYLTLDWYSDPDRGYAPHLVGVQQTDGAWIGGHWSSHPLASAWAILTLKKTVVQPGPAANAGPDVPSHPPLIDIPFDATGSHHPDPSGMIVQYVWDFGDGSPMVEGPVVQHSFPAYYLPDGSIDWTATTHDYTVSLTVVDNNEPALTDTDSLMVQITPPPWPPVADAGGPYTSHPCWLVHLDGSGSYDPNGLLYPDPGHPWHGELVSWEWDLDNDGAYDDASGEVVTWTSCTPGIHVVGLRVTNSFGESDSVDTVVNLPEPSQPVRVSVDIKPGSCPNPIEVKQKGVLAAAIVGSADFDVSMVDPATVTLEGLSPLRWSLDDVATPYQPLNGTDAYDCHEGGPDGIPDLTLKFKAQELIEALGEASDGDALVLTLSGMLKEEFGATAFFAEDVVIILAR